jgi:hypothetical protein
MNEKSDQKFAYVAVEHQKQGIRWLRLSPESLIEDGVYILQYDDLSKPALYDWWFEDLGAAMNWAKKFYGIEITDWQTAEILRKRGIQIIDEF